MNDKIKDLLLKVDKPSRYCGGEFNTPEIKSNAELKFLMCFPDTYEVAHSNLGIKILYRILNNREDTLCETCYAPWPDMGKLLKESLLPLFSIENQKSVNEFDIIGFSMQYELSYTNSLYMLELGGVPLLASERGENDPIVCAGGPCAINPMPIADFFDFISIGDGEEVINSIAEIFCENKKSGGNRKSFLEKLSKIDGIFVPSLNQESVKRAIVLDLDKAYFPTKIQIPNMEAIHNRAVLEVFRGCTRGCRFCQAGMIYRPVRERSSETLIKYFEELIVNNGFDEVSLSSLSTCDYSDLHELLIKIKPIADRHKVSIALPSTRVDSFEAEFVESSRKNSITFAPEAGTQRLRDVINKNITEDDIINSLRHAFSKGYSSIKLYFMIGLPTETMEDIEGIFTLAKKIKSLYKEINFSRKPLSLSVSTSTFVPKPFTPFQWERQISLTEIYDIQSYLRNKLRPIGIKFSWHDSKTSRVEAAMARGGRELGKVILSAYKKGCIFDGWTEHFNYEKWLESFSENSLSLDSYTEAFNINLPLAWDKINSGVKKSFLLCEREKAYKCETSGDCRKGCENCGITDLTGKGCL